MALKYLGDIASEVNRKCKDIDPDSAIVGLEHLNSGEVELCRWDQNVETTFTKGFSTGDVLFGRRRAYLRKAAVAARSGVCSGDIIVIRPKDDMVEPRLLPFIIQNDAFFNYAIENSAGSLSPRVKWERLRSFRFNLPDKKRQKQLAALLWSAQALRKYYQGLIAGYEELIKSQFIEMFGDPYSNSFGLKTIPLKDACKLVSDGPFGSNLKSSHYVESGVRVIRLGNIGAGVFIDDDKACISEEHYQKLRKYTCAPGDVVIGTLGDPNLRACLVPTNISVSINKSDCVHVVPKPELLENQYVCAYFNLDGTLALAKKNMHGNTRSRITMSQVASLPIMIPPLGEQHRYAEFIRQVDKSKFEVQQALDSLNKMTTQILNKELGLATDV